MADDERRQERGMRKEAHPRPAEPMPGSTRIPSAKDAPPLGTSPEAGMAAPGNAGIAAPHGAGVRGASHGRGKEMEERDEDARATRRRDVSGGDG